MWMPRDWGEGAATKELGEGTWSDGLPGEPWVSMVPGDGVPIMAGEGATPG